MTEQKDVSQMTDRELLTEFKKLFAKTVGSLLTPGRIENLSTKLSVVQIEIFRRMANNSDRNSTKRS
jgi:hypothetical protein